MKRISIFFFLATVALFVGCESDAELPNVITDDTQTAVPPTKELDEPQMDMTKPEATPPDIAKPTVAPDSSPEIVFGDQFPKVLAVKVTRGQSNQWRFDVTLSSPYDSRQRYADAWRVLDDQDNELGIRILGHDHASEQPFTRSGKFEIPEGTKTVFVEGRDQANGWSGQRFEFKLP